MFFSSLQVCCWLISARRHHFLSGITFLAWLLGCREEGPGLQLWCALVMSKAALLPSSHYPQDLSFSLWRGQGLVQSCPSSPTQP